MPPITAPASSDRNRFFVGPGIRLSKAVSLEISNLNQHTFRPNGPDKDDHFARHKRLLEFRSVVSPISFVVEELLVVQGEHGKAGLMTSPNPDWLQLGMSLAGGLSFVTAGVMSLAVRRRDHGFQYWQHRHGATARIQPGRICAAPCSPGFFLLFTGRRDARSVLGNDGDGAGTRVLRNGGHERRDEAASHVLPVRERSPGWRSRCTASSPVRSSLDSSSPPQRRWASRSRWPVKAC